MSKKSDRKLAVILFADIAGYTSLMQENESLALDMLQKFKSIIHQKISEYAGHIVQYFGDGCLIAFESSTQGVRCAIELQKSFNLQNSLPVRIGMHLGEVLFKEENVYGDGVNIASRIESIGIPGSILFSKAIRDQILNKEGFEILSLGSFDFKNVNEPIEVYALSNDGLNIPDRRYITGKLKEPKPSLLKRRDVQASLVVINLMIVVLLSIWYFNSNKKNAPIKAIGNKYILAIGVDNNPNWLRLYNAKNDAMGVVDVLQGYFGFQLLDDPLINESATKDQILNSIDRAKDILQKDDQLMVFYAGHGYSDLSKDDPEGYIVPYDGPGKESQDLNGLIKISDFLGRISELPARHITTIFDACYSGFALQDQLIVSRGSASSLKEASMNASRKVFSSADHDQIAADSGPIAEHSLFSGFLIEGLRTGSADRNADEIISMNELAVYLETSIYDYSSSGQIPRYGNFLSDSGGEMLLQYDNDQLRKELPVKDIIKGENEIYTALPFRTSSTDDEYEALKTYLPEIIIEALGEYDKRDYKIVNLNLLTENDSVSTFTPLSDFINRSGITKYFTGTFNLFDDKAVIKISLYDARDASIIYTFPDIITNGRDGDIIFELASFTKKYVKGFLDNTDQVMTRITNPPNYEAYKELKRAYHHMKNDEYNNREKALDFINNAIDIDPEYFRAHLAKVWTYIACHPVDVSKAREEYHKLKGVQFNISDYEEERLSFLFYEAVGDYPELVKHKLRILKDYPNRSVFNDAIWYAVSTNNHTTAYEMIGIVEENELDVPFKNDIFIWKNIIERQNEPFSQPIYYERFKRETDLVQDYFKHFIRSKLFFDCKMNCFDEFEKLITLHKPKEPHWWYYQQAGTISEYKGNVQHAKQFYKKAQELYLNSEDPSFSQKMSFHYFLKNYEECKSMSEKIIDDLIAKEDFSSVRYYLLSIIQLGEEIKDKEHLLSSFKTFKKRPGICYYYLATIHCADGNYKEANKLLKMALENSIPFDYNTYLFDPDLKPMWDDPEFLAFTTPK